MSSLQASPYILKLYSPDATLELVGGKGASLARMAVAGLPVPPGFQITTHAYPAFLTKELKKAVSSGISILLRKTCARERRQPYDYRV
jgi:phosphoenolpyruvate synthase/pyruvate phosphate dikinase